MPRRLAKTGFAAALAEAAADHPEAERIRVKFQDEAGVGQKSRRVRRCFQRGMWLRMGKHQRSPLDLISGAVCPVRDIGDALVLPHVSVAAMNLLLSEVASQLPPGTEMRTTFWCRRTSRSFTCCLTRPG